MNQRWRHGLSALLVLVLWVLQGCGVAPPSPPFTTWLSPETLDTERPQVALQAFQAGQFSAHAPGFGRGYLHAPTWVVVRFNSTASNSLHIVTVGPALLDEVIAFQIQADGQLTPLGRSGQAVPREERSSATLEPAFLVQAPSQGPTQVLLQLRARSANAGYVRITTPEGQIKTLALQGQGFGILFGVLFAGLMASALVVLRARRQRVSTWLTQTGAGLLFVLAHNGMLVPLLPAMPVWMNGWIMGATGGLMLVSAVTFFGRFFDVQRLHPALYRLTLTLSCLSFPLAALAPLWGWSQFLGLAVVVAPTVALLAIYLAYQTWLGHPMARRFGLWAWLLGAGLSLQYLGRWGLVSFGPLNMLAWQAALLACYLAAVFDLMQRLSVSQRDIRLRQANLHQELLEERASLTEKVRTGTAELQAVHEELRREEQGQRELLQIAAESFRPPTRVIRQVLHQLEQDPATAQPELSDRLRNMQAAAERMQFLANRLISTERLGSSAMVGAMETVDIRGSLHEVLQDCALSIPLLTPAPDCPLQVHGDPVLLRIALHNLIDNAIRHTGSLPGSVSVEVHLHPQDLEIVVCDQGPGLSEAMKAKLFQRYQTTQRQPGHGLGLSIVAAIAEAHGGRVRVTDAQPRGARFHLTVPRARGTAGAG